MTDEEVANALQAAVGPFMGLCNNLSPELRAKATQSLGNTSGFHDYLYRLVRDCLPSDIAEDITIYRYLVRELAKDRRAERDAKEAYARELIAEPGSLAPAGVSRGLVFILRRELRLRQQRIRSLVEQLETAKRNEAICHCGNAVSSHNAYNDGHAPVPMLERCPAQERLDELVEYVNKVIEPYVYTADGFPVIMGRVPWLCLVVPAGMDSSSLLLTEYRRSSGSATFSHVTMLTDIPINWLTLSVISRYGFASARNAEYVRNYCNHDTRYGYAHWLPQLRPQLPDRPPKRPEWLSAAESQQPTRNPCAEIPAGPAEPAPSLNPNTRI